MNDGERDSVTILCGDGSRVEIKPGKSKVFHCRGDNRFHLLDCACEICRPATAPAD